MMKNVSKIIFLIFFIFSPYSLLDNLFAEGKENLLYQKKISDDPLRGRERVYMNIVIADLFPGGGLDIVTRDNKFLFIFDGITGENIWSYEIGYSHSSPVIDDIDQDGSAEIMIGNSEGWLFVLNFYERKLKKSIKIGYEIREIMVSDVNNDGAKDIGVFGREGEGKYRFSLIDGKSFALLWEKETKKGQAFWKGAFIPGVGDIKLVILNNWNMTHCYNALDGKELWAHNFGGRSFFGIPLKNWAMALSIMKRGRGETANIVVGTAMGNVFLFNAEGEVLKKVNLGGSPLGNVGFVEDLSVGDLNGDSYPDIVASSIDHKVYAIDGKTMKLLWKYKTGDEVYSSPALADLNNDRHLDVVVVPRDSYLYCINGSNGKLLWKYCLSEKGIDSAVLADVNRDGYIDVITGSVYGTLTVLTTDAQCEKGDILWGKKYGSNRIAGP